MAPSERPGRAQASARTERRKRNGAHDRALREQPRMRNAFPAQALRQRRVVPHRAPSGRPERAQASARTERRMRKEGHDTGLREQPRMSHAFEAREPRQPTAGRDTVPWEQRVSARALARMPRRTRKREYRMDPRAPQIGLRSRRDKRQQRSEQEPRMVSLQDGYPKKTAQRGRPPQRGKHCPAFRRQGKETRAKARSHPSRLAAS
jgi:hypothetical protein